MLVKDHYSYIRQKFIPITLISHEHLKKLKAFVGDQINRSFTCIFCLSNQGKQYVYTLPTKIKKLWQIKILLLLSD
jgi:hypothetical protein